MNKDNVTGINDFLKGYCGVENVYTLPIGLTEPSLMLTQPNHDFLASNNRCTLDLLNPSATSTEEAILGLTKQSTYLSQIDNGWEKYCSAGKSPDWIIARPITVYDPIATMLIVNGNLAVEELDLCGRGSISLPSNSDRVIDFKKNLDISVPQKDVFHDLSTSLTCTTPQFSVSASQEIGTDYAKNVSAIVASTYSPLSTTTDYLKHLSGSASCSEISVCHPFLQDDPQRYGASSICSALKTVRDISISGNVEGSSVPKTYDSRYIGGLIESCDSSKNGVVSLMGLQDGKIHSGFVTTSPASLLKCVSIESSQGTAITIDSVLRFSALKFSNFRYCTDILSGLHNNDPKGGCVSVCLSKPFETVNLATPSYSLIAGYNSISELVNHLIRTESHLRTTWRREEENSSALCAMMQVLFMLVKLQFSETENLKNRVSQLEKKDKVMAIEANIGKHNLHENQGNDFTDQVVSTKKHVFKKKCVPNTTKLLWCIRYGDEPLLSLSYVGLSYISVLIKNAGKTLSAYDIFELERYQPSQNKNSYQGDMYIKGESLANSEVESGGRKINVGFSSISTRKLKGLKEALDLKMKETDLDNRRASRDLERLVSIQDELDKRAVSKKKYDVVSHAINRTLEKLEKIACSLYKHLKIDGNLQCRKGNFIYKKEGNDEWNKWDL